MLTVQSNDFRNKEGSSESKRRKLFFMTLVVVVSFIIYTFTSSSLYQTCTGYIYSLLLSMGHYALKGKMRRPYSHTYRTPTKSNLQMKTLGHNTGTELKNS